MIDKDLFKNITQQLNLMSDDEKADRLKKLKVHLAAEMKRRKLKPPKPPKK